MCNCGGKCPICTGFTFEFVFKEKEQKVIKFEDVQVGDRVRLVNENGDTAEVTAKGANSHFIDTPSNTYYRDDGWSVAEILEKPMPNKPGTMMRGVKTGNTYVRLYEVWKSVSWDRREVSDISMRESFRDGSVEVEYAPE